MGSDREVFYITFKNESAGDHHSPLSVKLYKADSFSGDIRALQEIGDTKQYETQNVGLGIYEWNTFC